MSTFDEGIDELDYLTLIGGVQLLDNPLRFTDPLGLQPESCVDPMGNRVPCPKDVCATAECAAGIGPNPTYSREQKCRMVCNIVGALICTGAAMASGGLTTLGGAAAWAGCQGAKSMVCRLVCEDKKTCPAE